ncbi:MAG: hypothetical protein JOZ72_19975 [Alphaproteobacteria bacterium]|nr:hypothetical protein [Alphaproteobacteria bacterium]
MTLSVRTLERQELHAALADALCCRGPLPALHTAIVADHIRTLIWAPYLRTADNDRQPVHTSRIFAALDRNLRFLPAESADGVVAQHSTYEFVRDQLERCGDIVNLGSGYWIPGPLRLVRPDTAQAALIVTGLPTATLRQVFKSPIHSIGPARCLIGAEEASNVFAEERVGDWLGVSEPLPSWTEQTLAWAMTQLMPQADIEDDSLEIYAPDIFHARRRLGFWLEAKEFQESAPTLRLLRPKTAARWRFDRPDYLGIFHCRASGAQLTQAVQIPSDMAYRLRFGFDQRYGLPRTIALHRVGQAHKFELKFDLPAPEARILGLCWSDLGDNSDRYIDDLALPALKDVAAMLGIRILQS